VINEPTQKSGWNPYVTYAAVVLPLAGAVGTIAWVQHRRSPAPPPEPPVAVIAPPPMPVVPPPAELKPMGGMINIKSTGKSRVSTVGPAPEPPEAIVADPPPGRGGRVYRGGGPVLHSGGESAPPPPSSSRPTSPPRDGLTYRETVNNDNDPLLPFGPQSSEGSTSSNRRFNRR